MSILPRGTRESAGRLVKILVIASDIPATANMAGSPRLFSLCRSLAEHHALTLAAFCSSAERQQAYLDDPATPGVFERMHVLPSRPAPDWLGQQVHRLWQEVHFGTRFRNRAFTAQTRATIRALAAAGGFDLVYVDGLPAAPYVIGSGISCRAAVDLHDCISLLYRRKIAMERNWLRKLQLRGETRSITYWERSVSSIFGLVIFNSRVDEQFFGELDPAAHTLTIANGVDSVFFHAGDHDTTQPEALLFTGVMSYHPNADAARFFANDILPLIRERRPDAEFRVVGKDPGEDVRALARLPGVRIVGEVLDMRIHVAQAGVFVCPLRWGAGVKNKILAALAMGKAVVATRLSIEGIELVDGVHVLLADEPSDFATQVVSLMNDPARARRLGEAGREFVTRRYSWESSGRQLDDALTQFVQAAARNASA